MIPVSSSIIPLNMYFNDDNNDDNTIVGFAVFLAHFDDSVWWWAVGGGWWAVLTATWRPLSVRWAGLQEPCRLRRRSSHPTLSALGGLALALTAPDNTQTQTDCRVQSVARSSWQETHTTSQVRERERTNVV